MTGKGASKCAAPTHPHLHATLLMIGVVVFLIAVSILEVL